MRLNNDDHDMSKEINDILYIYYAVIIPIIAVLGFAGNMFVLYILLRYYIKYMQQKRYNILFFILK